MRGFGATRGTLRSALEMLKGGDLVYENGDWANAPGYVAPERFDFPEPLGTKHVAKYPAGEIVTVPRHTRTRRVHARITSESFVPSPRLAGAMPYMTPVIAAALRTPLRAALHRAIERLPEGPAVDERRAPSHDRRGRPLRGWPPPTGRRPWRDVYGITASRWSAPRADVGARLRRARARSPGRRVRTCELLDSLAEHGISWSSSRSGSTSPSPRLIARSRSRRSAATDRDRRRVTRVLLDHEINIETPR